VADIANIDRNQDDPAEQISAVLQLAGISQVGKIERILSGGMNQVYIVDDELVIRINDGRDGRTFERESKILKTIKGRVKVPEIVFSDFSQTQMPFDIMVLKRIPGQPLVSEWSTLNDSQRRVYIMRICDELRKLHGLPLGDIRELGEETPWATRVEQYIEECLESASQDEQIDHQIVLFLKEYFSVNKRELQNPCQQVLTHNDIHFGNILVSNGELQALLDFEYSGICPIDFELAKIINFCFTPGQYVEKKLERHYDKPMPDVLKWFMEFYPELFQQRSLAVRQRLFLIPEILWGFKVAYIPKVSSDRDRSDAISPEELIQKLQMAYDRFHYVFGEQFPHIKNEASP